LNDLIMEGRERVSIGCAKCERIGSYGLAGLISAYGIDTRLPDLPAELAPIVRRGRGGGSGPIVAARSICST
jgi:hypothetical protein